jgi:hypothetical protein
MSKELTTALEQLRKKGYNHLFELRFDSLIHSETEEAVLIDDFEAILFYENTNTSDYLYQIETIDNIKGVFIHNNNEYKFPISIEMIDKFKLPNKSRL